MFPKYVSNPFKLAVLMCDPGQLFWMVSIMSINQLRHVSLDTGPFGGRERWQRHSISGCLTLALGSCNEPQTPDKVCPIGGSEGEGRKGALGSDRNRFGSKPCFEVSFGFILWLAVPTCVLRTSCLHSLSLPFLVWIMDITVTIMQDNVRTEGENISRNKTQMKLSRKQIRNDTCVLITGRERTTNASEPEETGIHLKQGTCELTTLRC